MALNNNIVTEWLKSLGLAHYAESFIDNGYDDLEICKQIGDPDLDAIGVLTASHRQRLLSSVKHLREKGAASVYFTLGDLAISGASSSADDSPTAGPSGLCQSVKGGLEHMLRRELMQDGVRLSQQPYSMQDGTRGYLEGLAGCYADLLSARYSDVLLALEELRRAEVERSLGSQLGGNSSLHLDAGSAGSAGRCSPTCSTATGHGTVSPGTPPAQRAGHRAGEGGSALTTSHSQPIYVPGKYSPSSCLSDKEEDEIYGFGYGVFGAQMARLQGLHSGGLRGSNSTAATPTAGPGALPPATPLVAQGPQHQNYQSCLSPRSAYFYEFPPSDCSREGGKKRMTLARLLRGLKTSHRKDRAATANKTMQRDGDKTRQQMNGGPQYSFEETIHRLKVQEAMRKKERFQREHDEILRDIRHGLLQMSRDGGRGTLSDESSTYESGPGMNGGSGGHWYDEPPYESDPEDFLMPTGGDLRDGAVCFRLVDGAGVISLRSAGDISLPHHHRRGLILPHAPPHPPTVIPLTRASRYDDNTSVTSRLSQLSAGVEAHNNSGVGVAVKSSTRLYRRLPYRERSSEDGASPSQSSDYEETDARLTHLSADGLRSSCSMRCESNRTISRPDQPFPCSTSSVESLPSASGSSTQALVRAGSPHSSLSAEDRTRSPVRGVLCRARALADHSPGPYNKDALRFKKGDIIDVLSMHASGVWHGACGERTGHFSFSRVEVLPDLLASGAGYPHDDDEERDINARIRSAARLLRDLDSGSEADAAGSSSEGDDCLRGTRRPPFSPFRRHFPRDSGCYDGSGTPLHVETSPQIHRAPDDRTKTGLNSDGDNLDSVVQQCSDEILKRVENAKLLSVRDDLIERCPPGFPTSGVIARQTPRVARKGLLGGSEESRYINNDTNTRSGACLSEKSSDSGVSSSSLSSAPTHRELRSGMPGAL